MPSTEGQPATSPAAPIDAVTRLVATEQIRSLKARYTRLLDTQRWDDLVDLFVHDAHFVLANFGEPLTFRNAAEWMAYVRPLLTGGTTVHQVHQSEIEILDADTARARWAMTDYVVPAAESGRAPFDGHGHYRENYRRMDGEWKIVSLELSRLMLNGSAKPRPSTASV